MTRVHGIDGCRSGWAVVSVDADGPLEPTAAWRADIGDLVGAETVAVDIPIGLPERIVGPGRAAEQAIRPLLGPRRASVFSMPSRAAVAAGDYASACALARATSAPSRAPSIQAFNLFPLIRAVDALLDATNQAHVFECHAELAFWRLNGEVPMTEPKAATGRSAAAQLASRVELLVRHGFHRTFFDRLPRGVPLVDLVDASAIALIARRCHRGEAVPFPDPPDVDGRGLRIAIWA